MATQIPVSSGQSLLERLLNFLTHDPHNKNLLVEAAEAAIDVHDLDTARILLDRLDPADAGEERAANLAGLVALRQGRGEDAIRIFASLLKVERRSGARLNLAWAHLLMRDYESVLATFEDASPASDPVATRLQIEALHHLGRLDEALALGEQAAEAEICDAGLFGMLSNVALDAGDTECARTYAMLATDHPDGMSTLGMLALSENNKVAAATLFERALATQPTHARATIGRGLVLIGSDPSTAAAELERGAVLFGTHLGSWIAAGWGYAIAGDVAGARRNFERARTLDDTFSEVHGGLAVLAILEGDLDSARAQMRVALRLDGQSLGGRLAQMMLLEQAGKPDAAAAILRKAFEGPLGLNGQTLQQALAGFTRARP